MNAHAQHPFPIDDLRITLADLHLRELHHRSVERQLAAHAAAARQLVASRRLQLPTWLALPWRTTMRTAAPLAQ